MIGRVYFGEEMIQEADDEFYLCYGSFVVTI